MIHAEKDRGDSNYFLSHQWNGIISLSFVEQDVINANYSSYMDVFSEELFFQLEPLEYFLHSFLLPHPWTAPGVK